MQHIPVLAELTGLPLDWWLAAGPINGASWGPWPFADWIDYATIASLPAVDRRYLALCLRNGLRDLRALDERSPAPERVSHHDQPKHRDTPPSQSG